MLHMSLWWETTSHLWPWFSGTSAVSNKQTKIDVNNQPFCSVASKMVYTLSAGLLSLQRKCGVSGHHASFMMMVWSDLSYTEKQKEMIHCRWVLTFDLPAPVNHMTCANRSVDFLALVHLSCCPPICFVLVIPSFSIYIIENQQFNPGFGP